MQATPYWLGGRRVSGSMRTSGMKVSRLMSAASAMPRAASLPFTLTTCTQQMSYYSCSDAHGMAQRMRERSTGSYAKSMAKDTNSEFDSSDSHMPATVRFKLPRGCDISSFGVTMKAAETESP